MLPSKAVQTLKVKLIRGTKNPLTEIGSKNACETNQDLPRPAEPVRAGESRTANSTSSNRLRLLVPWKEVLIF